MEDKWLLLGHLSSIITYRHIHNLGFTADDSVKDLLDSIGNDWPVEMVNRIPILGTISVPILSTSSDSIRWLGRNNEIMSFSIKEAWRSMQPHNEEKMWASMVWNKAYIPKHAVCTWLACWKRLPTQDRILVWKHEPPDMKCLLCHQCLETHDHLFFQCSYSQECLEMLRNEVYFSNIPDIWQLILDRFENGSFKGWSTLQKVSFSAIVYYIWRERNRRLFENRSCRPLVLFKDMRDTILARMAWKRRYKQRIEVHGRH